jgi:hypothetical protein
VNALNPPVSSCAHDHCGACCSGGCSSGCSGCGGGSVLTLTQGELTMLGEFAQTPFLPVARKLGSETPVCREVERFPAQELGAILTGLEQKRLIRIDYDLPLSNFDYAAYSDQPIQGSMALTALGQEVLEQIEVQGIG